MGTRVPLDDLPTIEHAIAAEGASPQVADIARSIYQQESSSGTRVPIIDTPIAH